MWSVIGVGVCITEDKKIQKKTNMYIFHIYNYDIIITFSEYV